MKQLRACVLVCILLGGTMHAQFQLGLEGLSDQFIAWLKPLRVGLVTNQTGRDQQGRRTVDVLRARGVVVDTIFVPEHGLDGKVAAAQHVDDGIDMHTKIPIVSLYNGWRSKKIKPSTIKNIDVLLYDMQDAGMRHYTYISTLLHVMQAASEYSKHMVVLDRPNLLGHHMEGPLVEPDLHSFVSIVPIPLRHGMTIGELAWYFNMYHLEKPIKLYVARMKNYSRTMQVNPACMPELSPNIKNRDACYGYSFLGLLGEVRPFELGVGTDDAFQVLMLTDAHKVSDEQWQQLRRRLRAIGIGSELYRCHVARKKSMCSGLRMKIMDINKVPSFTAFLTIVEFFNTTDVSLSFSAAFDKAVGTRKVQAFLQGKLSKQELMHEVSQGLHGFFAKTKSAFMYRPLPKIIELT